MQPCLIRATQETSDWLEFPSAPVSGAVDRIELISQAPEFLGMAFGETPLPRAVALLSGAVSNRVLVALDEAGKVMLVGCPDQKEETGISLMVGDLLAASGRLWHQPFAQLAALFGDPEGKALSEKIWSRVKGEWDERKFQEAVTKSLDEGKFPVVVVVDEVTKAVEDMIVYLKGMNINVRVLTYERFYDNGIEIVVPRVVGEAPKREEKKAVVEQPVTPFLEYTPTVTSFGQKPAGPPRTYEPFPTTGTTPKQQAILERLVYIEDLGLIRRGFEFFSPRAAQRPEAEGTIVIAVDPTRWPFPREDEVVVVVRTGREHLAGFLRMKQQEVEDFLRLLPRDEKREHKGALLLWARNPFEATQLVNELKALKEVSQTRPPV
ncbi:hypothetical protein HPY86_08085 [candidate division WOR-3 bacterium]|nr:hypothetical protein [candidate division WOR-3 bacterium]